MTWVVPLASLCIAAFALILSTFFAARSMSRSASSEWVDQLEKRIAECEADRRDLRRELSKMQEREVELLRRLVAAGIGA